MPNKNEDVINMNNLEAEKNVEHRTRPKTNAEIMLERRIEMFDMKYSLSNSIQVFVPVVIDMILVAFLKRNFRCMNKPSLYDELYGITEQSTTMDVVQQTAYLSTAVVVLVICSTMLLLMFFKYGFDALLYWYMLFVSLYLCGPFQLIIWSPIIDELNISTDLISMYFFAFNHMVMGSYVVMSGKGPLFYQQLTLMMNCVHVALLISQIFPRVALWALLILISIWDLVAVLPKWGPLRKLVETAHERNKPLMPALIYSTTMSWWLVPHFLTMATDVDNKDISNDMSQGKYRSNKEYSSDDDTNKYTDGKSGNKAENSETKYQNYENYGAQQESKNEIIKQQKDYSSEFGNKDSNMKIQDKNKSDQTKTDSNPQARRGMQLGLGDFIFYGILISQTSQSELSVTLACIVAIVGGLAGTLSLLMMFHKALPALPISIAFALFTYLVMQNCVTPMMDKMHHRMVFI